MRNKYRITFSKHGPARFIGHLDLQTLFQRAIKRAGLPVAFSKGFNPHQLISFALPLPLGTTSDCELVEIELNEQVDTDIIILALNKALPEGLEALSAMLLNEGEKTAAALVGAAAYRVKFPYDRQLSERVDEALGGILKEDEIIMLKRSKKGTAEADIRSDIFSLVNISEENEIVVEMALSAGSHRNLKPELAAKLICERGGVLFEQYKMSYMRTKLFLNGIDGGQDNWKFERLT